ncbi:MAG: hypothetical protein WC648_02525 [Candidatus Paceibacterota bacterium]|jgi:outer membrane lipoprotein-sorting protein
MKFPVNQELEKISKCRGNIISDAVDVEISLGWRLRLYFFPKTSQKAAIFHDKILNSSQLSFDKKISLYKDISYFKRLRQYEKIIAALRFVQKYRNAFAHWSTIWVDDSKNEIVIYNTDLSKEIRVNSKNILEFQENVNFLVKTFKFKNYQGNWKL